MRGVSPSVSTDVPRPNMPLQDPCLSVCQYVQSHRHPRTRRVSVNARVSTRTCHGYRAWAITCRVRHYAGRREPFQAPARHPLQHARPSICARPELAGSFASSKSAMVTATRALSAVAQPIHRHRSYPNGPACSSSNLGRGSPPQEFSSVCTPALFEPRRCSVVTGISARCSVGQTPGSAQQPR